MTISFGGWAAKSLQTSSASLDIGRLNRAATWRNASFTGCMISFSDMHSFEHRRSDIYVVTLRVGPYFSVGVKGKTPNPSGGPSRSFRASEFYV